jgi:hypothetical protein
MVLGANAPHITEISSSHNSERSDCLNHGFGRPDVASDREEGRHRAFGGGFLSCRIAKGYSTSSFKSGFDWQKHNDAYYDGDLPNSDLGQMVTRNREFLYYGSLGYFIGYAIAFTTVAIILPMLGLTGLTAYLVGVGMIFVIIGTGVVFSALAVNERCRNNGGCSI